MDDHLQALNIEERRVTIEPMEDLKEISLMITSQAEPLVSAYNPTIQFTKSLPSS